MAKIVKLIYTTEVRGEGIEENPTRIVKQWFDKDGTLIFEKDPFEKEIVNYETILRDYKYKIARTVLNEYTSIYGSMMPDVSFEQYLYQMES